MVTGAHPAGARCAVCREPMLTVDGCIPRSGVHRYGAEHDWIEYAVVPGPRCRDCNWALGQFHHGGCCVARCSESAAINRGAITTWNPSGGSRSIVNHELDQHSAPLR